MSPAPEADGIPPAATPVLLAAAVNRLREKFSVSPLERTPGSPLKMRSNNVVPDRGSPTMKMNRDESTELRCVGPDDFAGFPCSAALGGFEYTWAMRRNFCSSAP